MAAPARVFAFRDARWAPDPVLAPSAAVRSPQPAPLVIDNGSFQTRAGWACPDPSVPAEPLLRFRSLAARSRGARGGAGAETQVGNDLGSPEPLRWLLRSPFDRNVPVQLELQELLFDHVFQRLGVSSQVAPAHPRMVWVGRELGAPRSTPAMGMDSFRSHISMQPGLGHFQVRQPQLPWAACAIAPPSQQGIFN